MSKSGKGVKVDGKPLQIWLSEQERDALKSLSEKERRSMAAQMRHLLATALLEDRQAA